MTRKGLFHALVGGLTLAGLGLVSGCSGSGGSDVTRHIIDVRLESSDISDLLLTVSPRQGGIGESDACTDDSSGFGCDTRLESGATIITFDSDRTSDSRPYYVFVTNLANGARDGVLRVYVDGHQEYSRTFSIDRNSDRSLARVFFDDASDF